MSRRIRSVAYNAAGPGSQDVDKYTDRIIKLIPSDVVAAWVAVDSLIAAAQGPKQPGTRILTFLFVVFAAFAAAYTWQKVSENNAPKPYLQTTVSTLAFVVWVYAVGGPFPAWIPGLYNPMFGGILLIVFTLASGLVTHA
ncbi:MAG: hypothetical protein ABSB35_09640 [Bryobacteraceae bacterium]|jgi:hypothetical protein